VTTVAIGWLLASYVLGAVPTSYLAARTVAGIDLRTKGSGNLGATNLYRTLGWRYAVPVGLFDVAKGAIPVWVFGPQVPAITMFPLLCGLAAVAGHVFSVFVRFRGGKGVATAAGVVLGLAPLAFLAVAVVFVGLVWATGYVSLGSVVAAALFPLFAWLLSGSRGTVLLIEVALCAFLIWKHRTNIRRLIQGTENRFRTRRREGTA
jgi:glycerol-3-phosphate acyltransferase PlsY